MSHAEVPKADAASLVHEEVPRYDLWLKLVLGGFIALTLVPGIVFLSVDLTKAYAWLAITAFDALLFHVVLPRRFQIFEDRLRIVLGWPFVLNLSLTTIKEARPVPGGRALVCWGIRFVTSTKSVVEIIRHKGLNLIIAPTNRDTFLEQMAQALRATSE